MEKLINTTTDVRFDLKGELLEERSQDMAKLIAEKAQLEEEKRATAKSYKKKIDALNEQILKIGENMGLGFEIVEVACKKRKNYAQGVWEFIDNDTGEIIKIQKFVGDDYQTEINEHYD